MSITTTLFNQEEWKKEIINYIRAKLYSLDPKTRITQTTLTFNGDDVTTSFALTSPLRYIAPDGVTIDSVTKNYGSDWNIITDPEDTNYGKIVFVNAPATGTNNVSVTFGYGSKEWVYPDFPRKDVAVSTYPRIGLSMNESPLPGGLGGLQNVLKNRVRISVIFIDENTRLLDELSHALKNNIVKDAKKFYHFRYIQPDTSRFLNNSEDATKMVPMLTQDYIVDNHFEIVEYN
jgi:hypothetical protein